MWTPDPAALQHVLNLLKNAGSSDTEVQRQLTESMAEFKRHPLCCHYLAYVTTYEEAQSVQVRAFAAVILKQTLLELVRANQHTAIDLTYVKECAKVSLRSDQPLIRQSISIVVTTIVSSQGIAAWPEAIPFFLAGLEETANPHFVDGCIRCLEKICEDVPKMLDEHRNVMQPLVMKLIQLLGHPLPNLRRLAAHGLYQFVSHGCDTLQLLFDDYLKALLSVAGDADAQVRRLVCQSIVKMLDSNASHLAPYFADLVNYMLLRLKDDDQVAIEACEFWLAVPESEDLCEMLHDYLPMVVPALMACLVYSEDELATLEAEEEEEETVPDRDEDIAPRHHLSKSKKTVNAVQEEGEEGQQKGKKIKSGEEDDEEEEEEEEEEDQDEAGEWTLRKCAAASLDQFATVYGPDILPVILPLIEQRFASSDWIQKESGILALGAIAEGCIDGISDHLPGLIPYLLTNLSAPETPVRSITAWTLSRFAAWVCNPDESGYSDELYRSVLYAYLQILRDRKKKVQKNAVSAFLTLVEESLTLLIPYLQPILETICEAFRHYQHKNMLRLFDLITVVAESVDDALAQPEYIQLIMPPMIEKWQTIPDDSNDLFPLFEAFQAVASALKHHFAPFAMEVRSRCVRLITHHLALSKQQAVTAPTSDFECGHLIVALDLLAMLASRLGPEASASFVRDCQPPIMELMVLSAQHPHADVKQAAFALLGDLASYHMEVVSPHAQPLLPLLIEHIRPETVSIPMCNNATWAAGEIALKWGAAMQPFVPPLLDRLILILNRPHSYPMKTLLENAAITLGRIAIHHKDICAPRLGEFLESWLRVMGRTADNSEKVDAYRGFCGMVLANPNVVTKCFVPFVDALCYWQNVPPDLRDLFHRILHAYQQMYGEKWPMVLAAFPPKLRERFQRYA